MCCSRNLPWCLDLIFTTALETSSLLEYCNSQNQLPEQSGQRAPGASECQRALCPGSFRRLLTVNKHCSWAVSTLFMTKRSPRKSCLNLFQPEPSHCDARTTRQPLLIQAEELPTEQPTEALAPFQSCWGYLFSVTGLLLVVFNTPWQLKSSPVNYPTTPSDLKMNQIESKWGFWP